MRSPVSYLLSVMVLGAAIASAQNPTPFVNQPLIPAAIAPGGAGFTLTVNGTGFVSGSVVNWNGNPRATTFVSGSQVTAAILASDIAAANTGSVTVRSPSPGGGTSNVVFLPVREPAGFVSLNSTSFGTGAGTYALAVADFNKDGKQDMAIQLASSSQCLTSILLGNGDGTFAQGAEYQVCGGSFFVNDLNNDGNVDLIEAGAQIGDQQGIAVLLGNGDGTFQSPIYTVGPVCCGSVQGDFNRDGALDMAFAGGSQYCVFLGNGDGMFQPASCVNLQEPNPSFEDIGVGDLNGDGKLDLVLANSGNPGSIAVLLGNGDGTFQAPQTYPFDGSATSLVMADFNGDGKLDLAVVNQTGNALLIFLGNGDGTFRFPTSFASAFDPDSVAVEDMNGDGKLDLVVGGYGYNLASVSVLLGNGDGTFQNYQAYDGSQLDFLALGDFNNDGRLDVAVTNSGNTITILTQDGGTAVKLVPESLSFPIQLLDTVSNPKIISLTNTGSTALNVSNISISPNFSQLNNCKTVQPGGSCLIGVFFTPTATGVLPGYLSITDNGGGSPQIVNLAGVATIVSISPTKLNFGSLPVGQISTPMKVVVTNEGNGSMNISQIGIVGANKQDFSEVNACPAKLQAGASCTIDVIFHPSAVGVRNAILGIEDSGGGSPQEVPLTGTGTT